MMKRLIALFLAISLCVLLCSCGDRKALELSKSAFYDIHSAQEKLEKIGKNILSAWNVGISEEDNLEERNGGFEVLAANLTLSRDEILHALGYLYLTENDFLRLAEDKDYAIEWARERTDSCWKRVREGYSNMFSACVNIVIKAYELNGDFDDIEREIATASETIKELSNKYSDYEHYENLKTYFSTINTYYSFCVNPNGSYNQAKEDIHQYNNTADECYNELYYFFD